MYRCLDTWNDRLVALKCSNVFDTAYGIQQYKGSIISDGLCQLSDNFLKINDLSFQKIRNIQGNNIVASMELMGTFLNFYNLF